MRKPRGTKRQSDKRDFVRHHAAHATDEPSNHHEVNRTSQGLVIQETTRITRDYFVLYPGILPSTADV